MFYFQEVEVGEAFFSFKLFTQYFMNIFLSLAHTQLPLFPVSFNNLWLVSLVLFYTHFGQDLTFKSISQCRFDFTQKFCWNFHSNYFIIKCSFSYLWSAFQLCSSLWLCLAEGWRFCFKLLHHFEHLMMKYCHFFLGTFVLAFIIFSFFHQFHHLCSLELLYSHFGQWLIFGFHLSQQPHSTMTCFLSLRKDWMFAPLPIQKC